MRTSPRWRRALASVAVAIALGAGGAAAGEERVDPRVEQADGLLATEATYPEAIALYRAVLTDDPSRADVRLRLARVLAWSGALDDALRELDALVAADPNDLELRVERGEVRSWQGSYDAALDDLTAVVAAEPRNARAHRGIARVHRWSGRARAASRAYARALELEDDGEARTEWERMLEPYRPRVGVGVESFSDSSDFDRRVVRTWYSGFQDVDTRIAMSVGRIEISHPQDDVPLAVRSPDDDDRALEIGLRFDGKLDIGPRLTLELGGQDWSMADTAVFARAHVEGERESLGSYALHVVHEGFGETSSSFEAVQHDVRYTAIAASLYRQLTARFGLYGSVEAGAISDSNRRQVVGGSLSFQPMPAHDFVVAAGMSFGRYADESNLYYSPESDLGVDVSVRHRIGLTSRLLLEYAGALGYNDTDEGAVSDAGTLWNASTRVVWDGPVWTMTLEGRVGYSQRASRYHYSQAELRVERRF